MNFKLAEDLNRVEQEIVKKAGMLKNLIEQRNQLELEHKLKSQEMVHLQQELVTEEMKESQLSNRNTALRRIINNLDGNVKSEAENVGSDLRSFFKKLGLKVSLENDPEMETCNQLKIQFVENLNHHVILIYDSHMEDFDLLSMHPEHPRFRQLRDCLRQTGDIQGFLSNYRNSIIKATQK